MASSEPSPIGTALERIRPDPVIQHAERKPGHRSNENAARWARLERADTNRRKIDEGAPAKAKTISKDGSSPRREGQDNAAEFLAETARSLAGLVLPAPATPGDSPTRSP